MSFFTNQRSTCTITTNCCRTACATQSRMSADRFIENIGDLVVGERPLPRTFQRSRWGQNSKLRWHRAAPVHHCSRWLSKAKKGLGGGSSGGWRPEHQLQPPRHITQIVSLSQIDQKLLSGRSHLSSSAAHGLLRMLPLLGSGSNQNYWISHCSFV